MKPKNTLAIIAVTAFVVSGFLLEATETRINDGNQTSSFIKVEVNDGSPFYFGTHEVTLDEWQQIRSWAIDNGYQIQSEGFAASPAHPVTEVTWFDVIKWCNAKSQKENLNPVYMVDGEVYKTGEPSFDRLTVNTDVAGYRLPTLSEWTWAAKGGTKTKGFAYAGSNDLNEVGWFEKNGTGLPAETKEIKKQMRKVVGINAREALVYYPVQLPGKKKPNELGLYDMSGNASEWVWDAEMNICGFAARDPQKWMDVDKSWKETPVYSDCYLGYRLVRTQ
jgi:formylglycine-generating enzyme required for sulfatase activity